jgi:hypothetical protein
VLFIEGCLRFLRTTKEYSLANKVSRSKAFEIYCNSDSIDVEDQKFCYNTDSFRKDIFRLMELGADEFRICKKIKSINSDFCQQKASRSSGITRFQVDVSERKILEESKNTSFTTDLNNDPRYKRRGVIYI